MGALPSPFLIERFGVRVPGDPLCRSHRPATAGLSAGTEDHVHEKLIIQKMRRRKNFRRRTVREKDELRTAATGRVLEDIFPVLDTLGLAISAARQPNAEVKSLAGGVEMVLGQLRTALANHGLKEINPVGEPFDPHKHEAISHRPSKDVAEERVLEVVRPGYSLNGRLLRPASVVVSSGPEKQASSVRYE